MQPSETEKNVNIDKINEENQKKQEIEENENNKVDKEKDLDDKKEENKEENKEIEQKEETNEEKESGNEENESDSDEDINGEYKSKKKKKEKKIKIISYIKEDNFNNNNNEKTESVNKINALFESINNFTQLKNEVIEIKKKLFNVKDDEGKQNITNASDFEQKLSDLTKKFELFIGDVNPKELEAKDSEKEGNKPMNLSEISSRLRDFESSNNNLMKRFSEIENNIFGHDKNNANKYGFNSLNDRTDRSDDIRRINMQRYNLVYKKDFDEFKNKCEDEFKKIWNEMDNIKLLVNDTSKLNNLASVDDLNNLKNVILQKTEELFVNQNKKYLNFSSSINILQENFKKLLKLLSEKEQFYEKNQNIQPGFGGHSCASCETYIGDIRTEQKYINWNKFPRKEKENGDILKKVQNGYSRLLQMINFDSNGTPSLNPFSSGINNEANVTSYMEDNSLTIKEKNEIKQSLFNTRLLSSKKKNKSKEDNKLTSFINSKKDMQAKNKKLPAIPVSKSIDNLKSIKYKSNQNVDKKDINFINSAISQIIKES